MTTIRERTHAALAERYVRDGVASMTREQWEEWIDRIPLPEFMAAVDLSDRAKREQEPILKPTDRKAADQLRMMVEAVQSLKDMMAARRPVPSISLEVDPVWCRQNPGEAANKITRLTDALLRTIAHCDAAKHKGNAYRDEREAILEALCAPPARVV